MSAKTDHRPQAKLPAYTCSACGLAVIVLADAKIRACRCDATILAHAVASMAGRGGIKA